MEIRVFRNENSSQTNAYSHYSNYVFSFRIDPKRKRPRFSSYLSFCAQATQILATWKEYDISYLWVSVQELGKFHGIGIVSFHAHVDRFKATMKEESVKRGLKKLIGSWWWFGGSKWTKSVIYNSQTCDGIKTFRPWNNDCWSLISKCFRLQKPWLGVKVYVKASIFVKVKAELVICYS